MLKVLLFFSLSLPVFAITIDQCSLSYFQIVNTSELVINNSRVDGKEALRTSH